MTEPKRPSGLGGGGFRSPIPLRTAAILLMVLGAAGFVAARLLFGDQVLCLFGSTVVVFIGLGLIFYARRSTPADLTGGPGYRQEPLPHPGSGQEARLNPRSMPRGLRAAARQQNALPPQNPRNSPTQTAGYPPEPPPTEPMSPAHRPLDRWPAHTEPAVSRSPAPEPEPTSTNDNSLLDEVITTFEGQGARVDIETQRDERGILTIQGPDGLLYTCLVLQTPIQVEVAEVRALYALMTSSGSVGGYLISPGAFSQRAYDWAGQHRIRLVVADEIDELGI